MPFYISHCGKEVPLKYPDTVYCCAHKILNGTQCDRCSINDPIYAITAFTRDIIHVRPSNDQTVTIINCRQTMRLAPDPSSVLEITASNPVQV